MDSIRIMVGVEVEVDIEVVDLEVVDSEAEAIEEELVIIIIVIIILVAEVVYVGNFNNMALVHMEMHVNFNTQLVIKVVEMSGLKHQRRKKRKKGRWTQPVTAV